MTQRDPSKKDDMSHMFLTALVMKLAGQVDILTQDMQRLNETTDTLKKKIGKHSGVTADVRVRRPFCIN